MILKKCEPQRYLNLFLSPIQVVVGLVIQTTIIKLFKFNNYLGSKVRSNKLISITKVLHFGVNLISSGTFIKLLFELRHNLCKKSNYLLDLQP